MNNCPDCMTDENAVGEGVRCAAHEIAFLKKRLIESESLTEKELCPSPGVEGECRTCGEILINKSDAFKHSSDAGHHVELVGNQWRKIHGAVPAAEKKDPTCDICGGRGFFPGQHEEGEADENCHSCGGSGFRRKP